MLSLPPLAKVRPPNAAPTTPVNMVAIRYPSARMPQTRQNVPDTSSWERDMAVPMPPFSIIRAGTATAQMPQSQIPGARQNSKPNLSSTEMTIDSTTSRPIRERTFCHTRSKPALRPTTSSVTMTISMPVNTVANRALMMAPPKPTPSVLQSRAQWNTGLLGSELSIERARVLRPEPNQHADHGLGQAEGAGEAEHDKTDCGSSR